MPNWLSRLIAPLVQPARPRRRRRRTAAADFQRARVYRWEAEHVFPLDRAALSLEACRELVDRAYRWADGPLSLRADWQPPEVTDGRGRRHACGSRVVIKLPRWARTRPVVLHECAHGLAPDKHGPRFVRAYVDLLERFMNLDRAVLLASLEAAGVAVDGPGRRPRSAASLAARHRSTPPMPGPISSFDPQGGPDG